MRPSRRGMVIEFSESMSTFLDDETGNLISEGLALQVTRIYERAQHETLALLQSRPTQKVVVPVREWMSATQLAEYWQLYNDKNEPTTAGILKWSKRSPGQFPLTDAYMEDLLRFYRIELDSAATEDPESERLQKE